MEIAGSGSRRPGKMPGNLKNKDYPMISFQTNIDSLVAQQNLNINSQFQSNTIQQLTSGYRINSSGDDAAGLAVANQDRDQIAQITQGVANGNNGTALLQTMDGGMSNISQILDRLQTLAAQSASSSFTGSRKDLNAEFQTDVGELNRQAQAIGLNTGGTYAQMMDVYLGGGGGATAAAVSQNAQVSVNLSQSTVDAQSLGLSGMQVVAGTADISTGSAAHSVSQIVSNQANTTAVAGVTTFYLSGPGFSDNSKVALSVNLNGVSDTNTLVTAINSAITSAGLSASPAAQAMKNAGITASVSTDANGGQELAFSSSTSAFQVQAGDQMANALMGNLQSSSGSAGTAVATSATGGNTTSGAFDPNALGVTVQISGAGMANPVSINFNASDLTAGAAITDLQTQIQQNASLQAAGITMSGSAGGPLTFTSSTGGTFSVQSTGDTQNVLGLGNVSTSAAASSPAFYSTITAAAPPSVASNGLTNLAFSLDGGATGGAGPTIAGSALTTVNTSAMGNTALSLSINGTAVSVNFANDANKGAGESVANVVSYINSSVDAQMGWSSGVQVASVNGNNGITLSESVANASSTMTVNHTATSDTLGLTSGASITATPPTAASITGTTGHAAGVNTSALTGGSALTLTVNGTAVTVDFGNDANSVGTESLANITKYINNQVNAAMGWGSSVQVATVNGTSDGINLTDPLTESSSTLGIAGGATLGLANQTAAGTGSTGNTVTLNMAAGNATSATFTGGSTGGTAYASVNTSGDHLNFNIDGTAVSAALGAATGTSAVLAGGALTGGAAATIDTNALMAQQAVYTGGQLGSTVNTSSLLGAATYTNGPGLASDTGLSINGDSVTINGNTVNFTTETTLTEVAQSITSQTAGQAGAVTAQVVQGGAGYQIQLTSVALGTNAAISFTDTQGSQDVGLSTDNATTVSTGAAGTAELLQVAVAGHGTQTIDFSNDTHAGTAESVADINSFLAGAGALTGATAQITGGALVITTTAATPTFANTITVGNAATGTPATNFTAAAQLFGLATAGQTGASLVKAGSAATTLQLSLSGADGVAHAETVDFTNYSTQNGGTAETQANVAAYIQSQLGGYGTAAFSNGVLSISSVATGAPTQVQVTANNAASQAVGLTTAGQNLPAAQNGKNETLAAVVATLNTAAQQALGTSTKATIFSLNANNDIVIDSQTKGVSSKLILTLGSGGTATTTGLSNALGLAVSDPTTGTTLGSGTGPTTSSIASMLQQAFNNNVTLQKAGLQASGQDGGDLTINSSNNTNFRLEEYGSDATNLGFGTTAGAFAGLTSGLSGASMIDAGGTSAIGTGSTANPYISFGAMQFGSDAQAITVAANNSTGAQQALTITLRNDSGSESGATSGASIDSAVSYINQQLQQSNNPTLQSIVAVKENVKGVEQINFLSAQPSFSVSVGSSVNGNGMNGGAAKTFSSVTNGTGANAAIDTLAGAQAAVTAVTAAVAALGNAQATVGKGENQLNYAINLAQSQITNISAAESQIRDANVAQEAANLTKAQVLQQSTIAAMAQANQEPQAVLKLLQG